jgi:hypothetical protein
MESLPPSSQAEAVAVFRQVIIGSLTQAQHERGQLIAELKALTEKHFRLSNSVTTKRYSFSTLELWYDAYQRRASRASSLGPAATRDGRESFRRRSDSCCATFGKNTPRHPPR